MHANSLGFHWGTIFACAASPASARPLGMGCDKEEVRLAITPPDKATTTYPIGGSRCERPKAGDLLSAGPCSIIAGSNGADDGALLRKGLLIVGRNAGEQAVAEHFQPLVSLAKNVCRFYVLEMQFGGHFAASPNHGRHRSFSARKES